jgi:heat shock protein HslJ
MIRVPNRTPKPAARRLGVMAAIAAGITCGAIALATPPLLARGPLPPGIWRLATLDAEPNPWTRVPVTLTIADDGRTVGGSTGCNAFAATAEGTADELGLEALTLTLRSCSDEANSVEATVARVLAAASGADVAAGHLRIHGAGHTLVFRPVGSRFGAGVPGAPPVASTDRLDTTRFRGAVDAAAAKGAPWVRDPVAVALVYLGETSRRDQVVARRDAHDGDEAGASIVVWLADVEDDAVRARWFEVRLERGDDLAWRVTAGERASWCARGEVTQELVAGLCP